MVQSVSSGTDYASASTNAASEDVKTAIVVKMFQEMQESQKIAGQIIQDTVSISQEAIDACNAEKG